MYGFSYQGMTQLMAAAAKPLALRAICPAMAAWDSHADMGYENGAFRLQSAMGWAIQLAAETARRLVRLPPRRDYPRVPRHVVREGSAAPGRRALGAHSVEPTGGCARLRPRGREHDRRTAGPLVRSLAQGPRQRPARGAARASVRDGRRGLARPRRLAGGAGACALAGRRRARGDPR